jgi:hypothetical protein
VEPPRNGIFGNLAPGTPAEGELTENACFAGTSEDALGLIPRFVSDRAWRRFRALGALNEPLGVSLFEISDG